MEQLIAYVFAHSQIQLMLCCTNW